MDNTQNQELKREIQAILYPETPPNLNGKNNSDDELYKKHIYYNRRHNLRTTRFSYQSLVDPGMLIMLEHFYQMEVVKPNKIDEFDLGLSLEKQFFNDFKIINH